MAQLARRGRGRRPAGRCLNIDLLPAELLEEHIWPPPSTPHDKRSLKLTCRQGRTAVDEGVPVHHVALDLRSTHSSIDPNQGSPVDRESRWQCDRDSLASYLARLPHLDSLELHHWHSETALVSELLSCAAAAGHIAHLTLHGRGVLSIATARAVRRACPRLQTFTLGKASDSPAPLLLEGWFFLPLRETALRSVVIERGVNPSRDALFSLGQLTGLRQLHVHLSASFPHLSTRRLDNPDVPHLFSGLRGLQHCELRLAGQSGLALVSLSDAAPLLSSPHLTLLHFPNVDCVGVAAAPAQPGGPPASAMVALMPSLSVLCSLELNHTFKLENNDAAALRELTRLTSLRLHSIRWTHPTPGHLPRLQELYINTSKPSRTLLTLRPLLPLPALTLLNHSSSLSLGIAHRGEDDAVGEQELALQAIVLHLAAAPQLQFGRQLVLRGRSEQGRGQLTVESVAPTLLPLVGRISHISIHNAPLAVNDFRALHGALPGLRDALLQDCDLWARDLVNMVHEMPDLRCLHVCDLEEDLGQEGWLQVASRCPRPLMVRVVPPLAREVLTACRAHEGQMITWLDQQHQFEA